MSEDIWFLRCHGSEPRKADGLRDCPVIVLPRASSLGDYVTRRYRIKGEPVWIEQDAASQIALGDDPWFDFACMNCRRAFTYSKKETIHKCNKRQNAREYETLAQQSDSEWFLGLGIERSPKNPLDVPDKIYTIVARSVPDEDLKQRVLRIVRVGEDSTICFNPDMRQLPSVPENVSIIERVEYDFL